MQLHDIIAIILAVVFGGLIGFEREFSGKSAGLRTNVLIALGAALFTLLSTYDTRIASGVVTGVGFLGAGAIIQDRGGIYGLTTAATIWLVASVGMACGARRYLLAFIVTVLALIILVGFSRLEKYIQRLRKKNTPSNSPDN